MTYPFQFGIAAIPRKLHLKRTIVASFGKPKDQLADELRSFSERDWKRVSWWLDVSGMALYLLAEIRGSVAAIALPEPTLLSLNDRLERNKLRTQRLLQETLSLASWCESAGVPYALLKGISLAPHSVPDPALRSQADLDFLISRRSISAVRAHVLSLGYTLHADNGSTLEFRKGAVGKPDIANIYAANTQSALEIHVEDDDSERLARRCMRQIQGARIAVLCPADILAGQAAHLLKHLCGEHTRLSWVLEFARHVEARRGDGDFWQQVERIAAGMRHGDVAMAISLRLARDVFGVASDELLPQWQPDRIPDRVRLWLDLYAMRLLLSDTIGSKLYALLRKELASEPAAANTRRILFPSCLPKPVTQAARSETELQRMRRYLLEAGYVLRRLRFHGAEGARLVFETTRWRRAVARCGR